jgi:hypothetical protein
MKVMVPDATPPDIVILAVEWRPRAMIRAQLIEEGFDVAATNTWALMRGYLRPGSKPKLAMVDLHNLADSKEILRDLGLLMKPDRVLVLRASGTVTQAEIERLGFHVHNRPISIKDIIAAARVILTSDNKGP